MLQRLRIPFLLCYLSSGRLQEGKNKRNFLTNNYKSGRGRLREAGRLIEVPNIVPDLIWKLVILENWSLRRGSHLREVVATLGSTV